MKRVFFAAAGLFAGAIWLVPACGNGFSIDLSTLPEAGLEGGELPNGPSGVGEPCDATRLCRPGLACGADGKCAPAHSTAIGGDCQINAECNNGFCGPDRKCAAAGTGAAGAKCASDADCSSGLRCNVIGLATACQPEGMVDLNGACEQSAECFGGLVCAQNKCIPNPGGLSIPKFTGVACEQESGDPIAYFEVPRGGAALKDYFRLPFPNDIRTASGHPNLTDFPTPGSDGLGFDLVDLWARFVEKTATGFSTYPTVTFRFSGEVSFDSLQADKATHWVDLTDKQELGHVWSITTGRTAYVCPNGLSFRPPIGGVLKPNHTYGVYFTTAVTSKDGKPIPQPADLGKLLGATDPGNELSPAWNEYKLLRDWASSSSLAVSTILNAAVFTTGTPNKPGQDMGGFVTAAAISTPWTKCAAGGTSPCAQHDGDRNCPATLNPAFDEYHAVLKLPLYQKGNPPFIKPEDDGTFDPATTPTMIDVCAAMTVPTNASGDIPVLVYAHGTGGSFRSHADENVASRLAAPGINAAVLGIDQVGHGTRRGNASDIDPSMVFFNFTNPPAAQGNVLQGAADQVALVKYLQSGVSVGTATVGKNRIAYWGHSQGATEGAISMPYTAGVSGVLFSGEGGSLIDSLLTKTSPTNLKALAPFILSEAPANVDSVHPVLSMFQNGIDPADPLNHAANINPKAPPPPGVSQKHVFVPYGQQDTFATPITQRTYITAANLFVAPTPAGVTPDPLNRDPEALPVIGNSNGFTAVTRQYSKPANDDGHFVIFSNTDGRADGDTFLKAVLTTATAPKIPGP